ncbi:MAG: hypothetical protein PHT07_10305 [Paludibacter sp.]|nr:hypothetical protein [Paludibacter sp.]
MNTSLSQEIVSKINSELVRALRCSDAENICLDCAQKQNNSIVLNSHYKSPWTMADTGVCLTCGAITDVFCEAVIKVQQNSELETKDFFGNFPRILGGSESLKRHNIFASKPHANYVIFDVKSKIYDSKPSKNQFNWKRWTFFVGVAAGIVISVASVINSENYRTDTIVALQGLEPTRIKANNFMLHDYEQISNANIQLPISQALKKEHLETILKNEKNALDDVKTSLQPLNYYRSPENVALLMNDVAVIDADKMRMLYMLMQYKNAYLKSQK